MLDKTMLFFELIVLKVILLGNFLEFAMLFVILFMKFL